MIKKIIVLAMVCVASLSLVGCGARAGKAAVAKNADGGSVENVSATKESVTRVVDDSFAEDKDALIAAYANAFEQVEYTDVETGLSVTYNLFLPDNYDENGSYPMVVFIADSSCVGDNATKSLTQGRGALVWVSEEWQKAYPCVVLVPTYPETILDDQNGYSTTGYVELTKRLIEWVVAEYAVDSKRIYGTGQSMGCMTTLILASEYQNLYAACMFVDGQWDESTLSSLENQAFVYFAAEDDENAYKGMRKVMDMFDVDGAKYSYMQWDGGWSSNERTVAAEELFANRNNANFISWKTGTIEAASMGGFGGGHGDNGKEPANGGSSIKLNGSKQGAPGGNTNADGDARMKSVMYHMASFDYAYNCVAVMEWLFSNCPATSHK